MTFLAVLRRVHAPPCSTTLCPIPDGLPILVTLSIDAKAWQSAVGPMFRLACTTGRCAAADQWVTGGSVAALIHNCGAALHGTFDRCSEYLEGSLNAR